MERLQGPINHSSLFGEHFDHQVEWLVEQGLGRFEDEIEDKMPFLQMLQSVDQTQNPPLSFWGLREPSFQTLLKLQHTKSSPPWDFDLSHHEIMESQSCVDYVDDASPAKPEEALLVAPQQGKDKGIKATPGLSLTKERRKRKRARAEKNKEEVESQRMTHIAVERNRRRQMNDHLNVLRSLMPSSYIQRGDQASIVGGAIDFVKELEQLLQSLETQKRMRKPREESSSNSVLSQSSSSSSSSPSSSSATSSTSSMRDGGDEARAQSKSEVEATVIQNHVNLKVRCRKRPGQLLEAIVALEELRLSVLHLNVTSSYDDTILYSFNLKIEDDCQFGSADEIAGEVHRIFGIIDQQS